MSSSWTPTSPRFNRPVPRSTQTAGDISLRHYTHWRSTFEKLIAKFPIQNQDEQLASITRSTVRSILYRDGSDEIECFLILESVIRSLSEAPVSLDHPVAYGSYVVRRETLKPLVAYPTGTEFSRYLYSILPMPDGRNDVEFSLLLLRQEIPRSITLRHERVCELLSSITSPSPYSTLGKKRPGNAPTQPAAKRRALGSFLRSRPAAPRTTPSSNFSSETTYGLERSAIPPAQNIQDACAQFTKLVGEEKKKNAMLAVRITKLEDMIKKKDAEIEALKNTVPAASDPKKEGKGGNPGIKLEAEKERFAREKQSLAAHISSVIQELQVYKEKMEHEIPENRKEPGLEVGQEF